MLYYWCYYWWKVICKLVYLFVNIQPYCALRHPLPLARLLLLFHFYLSTKIILVNSLITSDRYSRTFLPTQLFFKLTTSAARTNTNLIIGRRWPPTSHRFRRSRRREAPTKSALFPSGRGRQRPRQGVPHSVLRNLWFWFAAGITRRVSWTRAYVYGRELFELWREE